jgi:hypothetical protein
MVSLTAPAQALRSAALKALPSIRAAFMLQTLETAS